MNTLKRESESEFRGIAWANIAAERLAFPRRFLTFPQRIGFIGSEFLYRSLKPECHLHLLTRANWRVSLREGLVDLVLVEPCLRDIANQWHDSTFDAAVISSELEQLIAQAQEYGIPVAGWITSDVSYWQLHGDFSRLFDATFCSDFAFANRLIDNGCKAHHLPNLVQPSIHNPFVDLTDGRGTDSDINVLYLGWTSILADRVIADRLAEFVPLGLKIAEHQGHVRYTRKSATADLSGSILGCVETKQLLFLLKSARVLLQVDDGLVTRQSAERLALEAAACQCAVVVYGNLSPEDARTKFARAFSCWDDLKSYVNQLLRDRILWLRAAQLGWRIAQEEYSIEKAVTKILGTLGISGDVPKSRASVITPSFRPEQLVKALKQFRAQTWTNKELILVANSNSQNQWQKDILSPDEHERIIFLPREHWAGTALNVGARRATGLYVFRMDDDDYYGENYVKDMMLSARCVDADVLGKQGEFFYSTEQAAVFRRPHRASKPKVFDSSDFSYEETPIAGFSLTMRREVAVEHGYPDSSYGFADSAFLTREREIGGLVMAITDNMNAIVERRSDPRSHTWQLQVRWESEQYERLGYQIQDLMI